MSVVRDNAHSSNVRDSEHHTAEKKPLDGTTHAQGCHTWGRGHYECALARIKELEQLVVRQAAMIRKLQRNGV